MRVLQPVRASQEVDERVAEANHDITTLPSKWSQGGWTVCLTGRRSQKNPGISIVFVKAADFPYSTISLW